MIRVGPKIDTKLNCPFCDHIVMPNGWKFTGMHIMFDCSCSNCKKSFFSEVPVNAGLFYPGMIDKESGDRCDKMPFENWYLNGLVNAYRIQKEEDIAFKIIKHHELGDKPIMLLNTIDATYGHALYELFNAGYYLKQEEYDLVIIVQKNMEWLVPNGAAQVWVVDISFSNAIYWYNSVDKKIKELIGGCREVFICRSFVQADSSDFNIKDYAGIDPFPLEKWDEKLNTPTVTFIWRTDRFWRRILPPILDNRFMRKIFPQTILRLNHYFQIKWILRFSKEIKKQIPQLDFAISGMDNRKSALPEWIKDFRYPTHEDHTAGEQLKRYAQSHLVLGCNGSSLLLPGCLAGGVLNIVPGDQWAVSAGTFPFRITSIGDTHFRYSLLPAEITIKRLVSIVVSVLRDRSYIELQTSYPWRQHGADLLPDDWEKQRIKSFLVSRNFPSNQGLITIPKSQK